MKPCQFIALIVTIALIIFSSGALLAADIYKKSQKVYIRSCPELSWTACMYLNGIPVIGDNMDDPEKIENCIFEK